MTFDYLKMLITTLNGTGLLPVAAVARPINQDILIKLSFKANGLTLSKLSYPTTSFGKIWVSVNLACIGDKAFRLS